MRFPLRFPTIPTSSGEAWASAGTLLADMFTPTLRLGVTGLSRAGKTVLITALVRNLVSGGRLPFLSAEAEGRIEGAALEPQPDDAVPRFDYEAHLAALGRDPPEWPASTERLSELRVTISYRPESGLRRFLGVRCLNIDIVDYPGEWLTDLAMLQQDFSTWSREALRRAREPRRDAAAGEWLSYLDRLEALGSVSEEAIRDGARLYTAYLARVRASEPVATTGPGRFLMPGDLADSPLLTFFPLEVPGGPNGPRGALAAMLARRYDSYRTHVVRPFFKNHFSRLDRQIVLVDVLSALNAGPQALADLQTALDGVLNVFRPGSSAWHSAITGRRIDRLLLAATKADHLHHGNHDRLEAILRLMTNRAIARAEGQGAQVRVMALTSLRATREAEARTGGETLPCIVGVPLPGERLGAEVFDGRREVAIFPGDLPADPARTLDEAKPAAAGSAAFIRFRPPRILPPSPGGESPAAPHIRLDRALEFLIGDWLA